MTPMSFKVQFGAAGGAAVVPLGMDSGEAGGAAVVLLGMHSGEVEKGSIPSAARNSGIPIDH